MIHFNPLRTSRLSVDLRELTIDAAEELCMIPESLEQAAITGMLRHVVVQEGRPLPGQVTDPQLWTVQERAMVMAHYMVHTTESGDPNFPVGDRARFADYLVSGTDYVDLIDLGTFEGEQVVMRPLLGYEAEAIERLVNSGRIRKNRLAWWTCAMACQMGQAGYPPRERPSDAEFTEWLVGAYQTLRERPESEFLPLLYAFLDGTRALNHFFNIVFTDNEIAFAPREDESLPLARFPLRSAVRKGTLQIFGIAD